VSASSAAPTRFPRRPALRLLIMGPPGSGKGTQADAITAAYGIPAISTGVIFRRNVAAGTPLGVRAQHIMASGGYIDDEITNAVVANRLAEDDARDGFLLDGYPRTLPQVTALDQLLTGQSTELTAVVVLIADPEEVTTRLLARAKQQGRADDTAEAIRTRQQIYERETAPVLDTYRERRVLLEVDALGPPDEVTQRIFATLATRRVLL
jgi:adenylate kinase